jgi:hypothetical protein
VAELRAQARPQSIGSDQRAAAMSACGGNRHAVAVELEVVNPRAETQRDGGIGADRFEQRRLQVAAVDHPIGGAAALRGAGGERRARQHARSPRAHHPQLLRRDRAALKSLAQPERDQHARGIGRELNAGADLREVLRLLEHRDRKSALRDRQRRGQSADARAGDEHGARGGHGS